MKNNIFLLLVLVALTDAAIAQKKFKAGLCVGINATQFDGDSYAGYNKAGIYGGIYLNNDISTKWQWEFGILYSEKGARKNPQTNFPNQYFLRLQYVEVPLIIRYKYKKGLSFETGTGFGVLFKVYEEANNLPITGIKPFKKYEVPFHAGIGYNASEKLQIIWRFSYSAIPVRPHASGTININRLNFGASNNVLTFMIRYTFGKTDETE